MIDRIELDPVDLKDGFADEGCHEGNDCEHYVGGTVIYDTTDVRRDNYEFDAKLKLDVCGIERSDLLDAVYYLEEEEIDRLFSGYEVVNRILGRKGRWMKLEFRQIDGFEPHDPRFEPEYHEYPLQDGSDHE